MGWFFWSSNKKEEKDVPSNNAKTLTREERQNGWNARDELFSCLGDTPTNDINQIKKICPSEFKKYEGQCAKSWVSLVLLLILQ